MNLNQNSKTANIYTDKLSKLVDLLKTSYLKKGLTYDIADKFATNEAIKAMQKNATNDDVRFVMRTGTFTDMNAAILKFIATSNDHNAKQILYMNGTRNNFRRNERFHSFRSSYQNNRFDNNSRYNSRFYNSPTNGKLFRGRNNFTDMNSQRFFRNNNVNNASAGNRQVRVVEDNRDKGNSNAPQFVRLGEF